MNYEEYREDIDSEEGENNKNIEDVKDTNNFSDDDVEPVALSKKTTGMIIFFALVLLLMVMYLVHGCSVSKESNNSMKTTESSNMDNTVSLQDTSNIGVNKLNNTENVAENNRTTSDSSEEANSTKNTGSSVNTGVVSSRLKSVEYPVFSSNGSTTGIVESSYAYLIDGSYVYRVNIIVMLEDGSRIVSYFCPEKTYCSLSKGDALNVEYNLDEGSNISIVSISK